MPAIGAGGGSSSRQTGATIRYSGVAQGPLSGSAQLLYVAGVAEAAGTIFTASVSGSLQSGGSATVSRSRIYPVAGGAAFAGSATVARTIAKAGSGGLQTSGAATATRLSVHTYAVSGGLTSAGSGTITRLVVRSYLPSGGLQSGGGAVLSHTEDVVPAGGLQTSGSATVTRTRAYGGLGGVQTAGTALWSLTRVLAGSGGASAGGEASVSRSLVPPVQGGMTAGGSASSFYAVPGQAQTYIFSGTGGAAFSGAAASEIVPASPVQLPGSSTSFAGPMPKPQTAIREYAASGGVFLGGSAETIFLPTITWAFDGNGRVRIGGAATVQRGDLYAAARSEDDEYLLLG